MITAIISEYLPHCFHFSKAIDRWACPALVTPLRIALTPLVGRRGRVLPWVAIVILVLVSTLAGAATELSKMTNSRTKEATALMMDFAERTGLTSERTPQRYLWTDAFAVCNFLGLVRLTGEQRYLELALRLIDQVHHTLGQYRSDAGRSGWLSGSGGRASESHPTRGGLRIGKKLSERAPGEPLDERLEWDRDGQYFHYLTKWMHALDQAARATERSQLNLWARELAETAHAAFSYQPAPGYPRRMHWKMSVDLTRPLVPIMGQHDPLDGYITYLQLQSSAHELADTASGVSLEDEIAQLRAMIKGGEWATADPLGIGGLLIDAYRVQQMMKNGTSIDESLLTTLLSNALIGLQHYRQGGELRLPASYRLAFRELGLVIGLHAVERMWEVAKAHPEGPFPSAMVRARLQTLMEHRSMCDEIESFWREPAHQRTGTWLEHRDINEVMLATSLAPEGFLVLWEPD